jgi:hypothetical protein
MGFTADGWTGGRVDGWTGGRVDGVDGVDWADGRMGGCVAVLCSLIWGR